VLRLNQSPQPPMSPKNSQYAFLKHTTFHPVLQQPRPLAWRAAYTWSLKHFTVTFWFTITDDSSFSMHHLEFQRYFGTLTAF